MPTYPESNSVSVTLLNRLAQLGTELHANNTETAVWLALERTLADFFGYSLFTVLAFSEHEGVTRLHSTNTDLHPLGERKKSPDAEYGRENIETPQPPHRATWIQHVVVNGDVWRGSVAEDLKAAFEDWEQLWEAGLGSVMNIPVRFDGVTIGSLNVLDKEHRYDAVDLKLGILIAQLVAKFVHKMGEESTKKQTGK